MVSTSITRQYHTKPTPAIAHEPNIIWVFPTPWGFNYNATSLTPPGTQEIIHEKPTVRGTWASQGVKGWYINPPMEHYKCHHVYFTKKRGYRESDCVEFSPHNTPLPYNSSSENFIIAAHKLAHTLYNLAIQAPFSNISDSQMFASDKLSDMFSKVADNFHQSVEPPQ